MMANLACGGSEKYLSDCSFGGWNKINCSHAEDIGVICSKHYLRFWFLFVVNFILILDC
jgi:hypothetical protein